MIEAQTAGELTTQPQATSTPQTITTSMVIEDLDNGIDRDGIRLKYNLEKWEVAEMFKHPTLKGKKVKKTKKLSFQFLDDTSTVDPAQTSIPMEDAMTQKFLDEDTNFNALDQQTRVEEGLDHKGETFETDNYNNLI